MNGLAHRGRPGYLASASSHLAGVGDQRRDGSALLPEALPHRLALAPIQPASRTAPGIPGGALVAV